MKPFSISIGTHLTPPVPGYALANLRASIELMKGIALTSELRNALGHKYATFGTFSEVDQVELTEPADASGLRPQLAAALDNRAEG